MRLNSTSAKDASIQIFLGCLTLRLACWDFFFFTCTWLSLIDKVSHAALQHMVWAYWQESLCDLTIALLQDNGLSYVIYPFQNVIYYNVRAISPANRRLSSTSCFHRLLVLCHFVRTAINPISDKAYNFTFSRANIGVCVWECVSLMYSYVLLALRRVRVYYHDGCSCAAPGTARRPAGSRTQRARDQVSCFGCCVKKLRYKRRSGSQLAQCRYIAAQKIAKGGCLPLVCVCVLDCTLLLRSITITIEESGPSELLLRHYTCYKNRENGKPVYLALLLWLARVRAISGASALYARRRRYEENPWCYDASKRQFCANTWHQFSPTIGERRGNP